MSRWGGMQSNRIDTSSIRPSTACWFTPFPGWYWFPNFYDTPKGNSGSEEHFLWMFWVFIRTIILHRKIRSKEKHYHCSLVIDGAPFYSLAEEQRAINGKCRAMQKHLSDWWWRWCNRGALSLSSLNVVHLSPFSAVLLWRARLICNDHKTHPSTLSPTYKSVMPKQDSGQKSVGHKEIIH